ncbi:MAG: GNAT family N-acetyltransferase [Actinomycetales bacterium]
MPDIPAVDPPAVRFASVLAVGNRVSVRRRLPDGSLGDVVGEVIPPTPTASRNPGAVVEVRRRTGDVVTLDPNDVVAARVVPPAPPRRPRVAPDELLEVGAATWPAAVEDLLGSWRLRASGGFTRRANAVYPVGGAEGAGLPLPEALQRLVWWYRERGLPPQLVAPVGGDLAAALREQGWRSEHRLLEQVARAEETRGLLHTALEHQPAAEHPVGLAAELTDGWLRLARGLALTDVTDEVRAVLTPPPGSGVQVCLAALGPAEAPSAVARIAVRGRWASISALRTAPDARRQGLALRVMLALVDWAVAHGAAYLHLQVDADNEVALPLYGRIGFATALEQQWWHPDEASGA